MSETFRIALIGAGGIAGAHVGAAKNSGGRVSIAAVVDPSEQARQSRATETGASAFATMKDFLAAQKKERLVDGVVVCTPPSARIDIVAAAAKAGLAVMSEKPLAHTLGDAKKLASIAKRSKKSPLVVGYCHRFTPAVLRMKELLAEGRIGTLVRFENAFACDLPGHKDKWFSDPKKAGGGAMLDMGSHSFDLQNFLLGQTKVVGAVFDHQWKGRTETAGTVVTKVVKPGKGVNANVRPGTAGVIISGWGETSRFVVSLYGTAGMLSYDYEKPSELVFKDVLGKAEVMEIEPHDVRFTRQLVAFADATKSKSKTNLATFEDALSASVLNDGAAKLAKKK
jgi:predicted dehydrogenase